LIREVFGFGVEPITGRRVPSLKAKETLPMEEPVVLVVDDDASVHGVPNSILIRKPFASAQLLAAISQLLNTGSEGLAGK